MPRREIVHGTTVLMPRYRRENQAAYPNSTPSTGLGFPIARLLVVFQPGVGTVLEAVMGPYQGKQTGEQALLPGKLFDHFRPGEIVLADRSLLVLGDRGADGPRVSMSFCACTRPGWRTSAAGARLVERITCDLGRDRRTSPPG